MSRKKNITIFNEAFLKKEIDKSWNIVSSGIPNIEDIKVSINKWVNQLPYLGNKKEEELSSLFIKSIFNDSLDYLLQFDIERHLSEEKKTAKDGKKSDFALGYFHKEIDEVYVVAELKDTEKKLDEPQNRTNNQYSPVEQAFNYSHKHNGKCKWVIVSDFKEIRLYRANDSCKFEQFFLKDLKTDEYQFKKFIFLLHKDRLIAKNGNSRVEMLYHQNKEISKQEESKEQDIHILDRLNNFFRKLEGFNSIDPNFIAKSEPFHQTHLLNYGYYRQYTLFSNNPSIFALFQQVSININGSVDLKETLKQELVTSKTEDYQKKVEYVIKRLNDSLIHKIEPQQVPQAKIVSIKLPESNTFCDCLHCKFQNFQFDKIIQRLNSIAGKNEYSVEEAYMFSVIHNYKWAYEAYKSIRIQSKETNNQNLLLLATYNLKQLKFGLYYHLENENRDQMVEELENIDLHHIIHYSLDYTIDRDLRYYYLHIIENRLYHTLEYEVNILLEKIISFYNSFNKKKKHITIPSNEYKLYHQFLLFVNYTQQNSLIYSRFREYSELTYKIFKGFAISYVTSNKHENKIKAFNYPMLIHAIIHVEHQKLKRIFYDYDIEQIKLSNDETHHKLIDTARNLLNSYNTGTYTQVNSEFKKDFDKYFNNLFLILNKIKIEQDDFKKISQHFYLFVKNYNNFSYTWQSEFLMFIYNNGKFLSERELVLLFTTAIDNESEGLVKCISQTIQTYQPNVKIGDKRVLYKIFSIVFPDTHQYKQQKYLDTFNILSEENKKRFLVELENKLNEKFDISLYEDVVLHEIINLQNNVWFELFIKGLKTHYYPSLVHSAQIFYLFNLFEDKRMQHFQNLPDFETWLINPYKFNYKKFNIEWLYRVRSYSVIMTKLSSINELKNLIFSSLKENYSNSELSDIYFKYFA